MPPDILALASAPFIGSFIGVLAHRYPRLRAALWGRSRCPTCSQTLGALDLVPIASWLARRGRCRYCSARIAAFYPATELGALAIAAWASLVDSGWPLWASCLLGWSLLALALIDMRRLVLPDALTIPLAVAALVLVALRNGPLADHAIGAVIGFVTFAALGWGYRAIRGRDGLGLGDAKLLAAGGAWLSWTGLPSAVLIAATTALAATTLVAWISRRPIDMTQRIPFGPFLAFGIWAVWLHGPIDLASP